MLVVFYEKNSRIRFEVIKSSDIEEKILMELFRDYGSRIVKMVPVGYPIALDPFKLKKMLCGKRKRRSGSRSGHF